MSVNHPAVSHLSNQSHMATEPLAHRLFRASLQRAENVWRKHIISNSCWPPHPLLLPDWCISFENKAPFLSTLSFWQVLFLFICILYMFTLYLALPNRETILNVLSLLFYIGSASFIPHLQSRGPVAAKDEPPPTPNPNPHPSFPPSTGPWPDSTWWFYYRLRHLSPFAWLRKPDEVSLDVQEQNNAAGYTYGGMT